jgi:hypothetical protein
MTTIVETFSYHCNFGLIISYNVILEILEIS